MLRTLALRPGVPGFKIIPGSTSRLHLLIANWLATGQLGLLTVVAVSIIVSLALKSPYGIYQLSMYCILYYIVLVSTSSARRCKSLQHIAWPNLQLTAGFFLADLDRGDRGTAAGLFLTTFNWY